MLSLENCFLAIVSSSLKISIIIILILLVKPLLTKKYTAKCRYYLWIILIVCLLIPVNLSTSYSIIKLPVTENIIVKDDISNYKIKNSNINEKINMDKLENGALQKQISKELSITESASIIWILGVAIYLLISIFKHFSFINGIKRWTYDNEDRLLYKCLEQTKKELQIKSKIGLKRCKIIKTPMLVGIINSKIVMPVNSFSEDEIIFILKHELTHFKRKDLLYKLIILITNAVHWFNPIIYVMNKAIEYECEVSCDEAIMKSESISRRKQYGEMILNAMLEDIKKKAVLLTSFNGGKKEMKKRLKNIIDLKIKRNGIPVVCSIAVITILSTFIVGFTNNNNCNTKPTEKTYGENLKEENKINQDKDISEGNSNDNDGKVTHKEIIVPDVIEGDNDSKDAIILNSDVQNNLEENPKSIEGSYKDDLIQTIEGDRVDKGFCVKAYENLDKSFMLPPLK